MICGSLPDAAKPAQDSVHRLSRTLRALTDAMDAGVVADSPGDLPADPELQLVTAAIRSVLGVLTEATACRRPLPSYGALSDLARGATLVVVNGL